MKVYTLSTFCTRDYLTTNWFYASSKEEANSLIEEIVAKVKTAKGREQRIKELELQLWAEHDKEIDKLREISKWTNPKEYKAQEVVCEAERLKTIGRRSHRILNDIVQHDYLYKTAGEQVLDMSAEERKAAVQSIELNVLLPIQQTDGD